MPFAKKQHNGTEVFFVYFVLSKELTDENQEGVHNYLGSRKKARQSNGRYRVTDAPLAFLRLSRHQIPKPLLQQLIAARQQFFDR